MNELLQSLKGWTDRGPPSLESVNAMITLLDQYLVRDDVDMEQSIALTPVSDELLKLRTAVSAGGNPGWKTILSALSPLGTEGVGAEASHFQEVDDMDLLASFIQESQEHLESVDQHLLKLENEQNPEHLNAVFRAMHTIKGVAGFLHLVEIQTLSHALENLLDYYRKMSACPTEDCVDLLLEGRDLLSLLVADLEEAADKSGKTQGKCRLEIPKRNVDPILMRLLNLQGIKKTKPVKQKPETEHKPKETPAAGAAGDPLLTPELMEKFKDEVTESLDAIEQGILGLEKTADRANAVHDIFRLVHTVKGNAGFFGSGDLEQRAMDMEHILDQMRSGQMSSEGEAAVSLLLENLDKLRQSVGITAQTAEEIPVVPETRETVLPAPEHQEERAVRPGSPQTAPGGTIHKKEVRVDTDKLDRLFDLIGELITAEAMVLDHPQIKSLELEEFQKAAEYMSKITRDLQTVSMNLRMIPLEGLFSRTQRLIRDLAKKFQKPIRLNISGQETEMDRNIIEEIADPLVHIIRNAVDHGIESQLVRAERGKPSEGQISLSARYEGNEIWIIIEDDGAGLNREKIIAKALEREVLKTDPATMSDEQVWQLIFEPGFSTAEKVTEVSGRGVGMDVVKKNIEKLRGQVVIHSRPGQGSSFTLRIPLTLAIMDGITIQAGDGIFSLPVSDVSEFQNYDQSLLHTLGTGEEVLSLRGETLPFLRLKDFYGLTSSSESERPVVLLLRHHDKKMAIVVDAVIGYRQIVLKSLPEGMEGIRAVSGCTILGNGDVSLIIDTKELISEVVK